MTIQVQMTGLDFGIFCGIFHKNLFHRKNKKWKNKKTFVDRNGDSTGEDIGFPNFILKKARISVQLQLQLNSLRTRVVSLEPWILQTMSWAIITWETSTMVPLSYTSQGIIFHRHVRLDIWRCRSTRIHVRFHVTHRKTKNSNGNQVFRVISRTQWESMLRCSMFRKVFDVLS